VSQPRVSRPPTGPWAELASTLARRRITLGMTQRQAASLSDLSEKALRDIESGTVAPRLGALVAIAETLGMDVALTPYNARRALPPNTLIIQRESDPT
jgi:transcriptional regulator with XRE-family HTH domain